MVLDGLKGFQSKKSKFMTFNYKSADRYLVLPQMRPRVCTLISESFRIQDYASKFLGKGALTPKSFANIVLLIEEFLAAKKQL